MKDIHLRVDNDIDDKIKDLSKRRGVSQAEVMRQIFREYFSTNAANDSLEIITSILRGVVRSELKPTENRMAKLSAKSAIAGATSMFLCTQTIADLGKHDSVEIYQKARKKAVAYLKEKK
ncbi:MAG: ribbon-helix-helix protein, CopG family [Clostridium tyrobutyricum]|jgi:hypothetical protein|uniref:ribbon-helix-helix protein, CopG family n=1 Tax=Clostridium tyrobutyricum TaxID=1519 RepID=UPI002430493A|nr:ribbon-helix-helix protein, CopG family [Clostridium tyrobutyricum]MCH4200159.1 ribbon-helix-helix protein, CopG family [Clostridium tyrobutyricum]MCH4237907.1 ribbon-helix-helix protein, CopG family [Clostridium tyrobutyricum]MCH4259727.1 ribbon-helix-helix protein, CopG family [Clostridium tyrobutyricum]